MNEIVQMPHVFVIFRAKGDMTLVGAQTNALGHIKQNDKVCTPTFPFLSTYLLTSFMVNTTEKVSRSVDQARTN